MVGSNQGRGSRDQQGLLWGRQGRAMGPTPMHQTPETRTSSLVSGTALRVSTDAGVTVNCCLCQAKQLKM